MYRAMRPYQGHQMLFGPTSGGLSPNRTGVSAA